jgi:hypothetical protein
MRSLMLSDDSPLDYSPLLETVMFPAKFAPLLKPWGLIGHAAYIAPLHSRTAQTAASSALLATRRILVPWPAREPVGEPNRSDRRRLLRFCSNFRYEPAPCRRCGCQPNGERIAAQHIAV